jgi:hypothetical protein
VLAPGDGERRAAAAMADAVAGRGVAEPRWAAMLGRVWVGTCWRYADVYGDQATLLCEFGYQPGLAAARDDLAGGSAGGGPARHALVVLVDLMESGGSVADALLADDAAGVLADLRKDAEDNNELATFGEIGAADARALLERGFATLDLTWEPDVPATLGEFRALALARVRALPMPAPAAAGADRPPEIPDSERAALVERFLTETDAEFPDRDAATFCTRLVVDFGCDYDAKRPLRVSPAKFDRFLLDWVPRKAVLDDDDRQALPSVVTAWTAWAAPQAGLPPVALAEIAEATEVLVERWRSGGADAPFSPARAMVAGLEGSDVDELEDDLDRRLFTMPFFGTRIGDVDYPELDPGDEDDRRQLIIGEHPEYHAALDDPQFEGEIDGVNPRLHIAMHEIVANQLWANDPPEAWQAARALLVAGHDRTDVLHALGHVNMTHLHNAQMRRQPVDVEEFRLGLRELAAEAGGARPETAKSASIRSRPVGGSRKRGGNRKKPGKRRR